MASDSLTITDNRTGQSYEVPISDGTVRAMDLRQIKVDEDEFGMMAYDPAFTNTASCRSSVTYIDGAAGILEHRGYSIEQLCEKSTFLEVAYLLIFGELPTAPQLDRWTFDITHHTFVHEDLKHFFEGFRYDAHPMGMLLAGVGALSTFYPDAKQIDDPEERYMAAVRLIAKVPTLAAFSYRHNMGLPYVYPDNELNYAENFLSMMFKKTEDRHIPKEALTKVLDVLFILHADHEQNCSTNAVRGVGSSDVDPYSAVAAGVAALYGPLHGGANEAVLRMLRRIESPENIPDFLERVKEREEKLMGFGHRVYKNYDPWARSSRRRSTTRWSRSRRSWRNARSTTTTSPPASSTRTSTSTRGSSTRRWASRRTCSPSSSPSPAPPAGSRSGWRCRKTRRRKSPGRGRSTPARASSSTCRWTTARGRRKSSVPRPAGRNAPAAAPECPAGS
jgi:citrate synthase